MKDVVRMADKDPQLKRMWEDLNLGYTESTGSHMLLSEVKKLYMPEVAPQIVVVAPEEGIYLSMRALLRPGDEVVVAWPNYQSLSDIAVAIGCQVKKWIPEYMSNGSLKFSIDSLETLVNEKTRLIVINFPHNPSGELLTKTELRRVVEIARTSGAWLFSDEMYRGLEFCAEDRLPSICEMGYEQTVGLCGMSKTYAMPGIRIGWIATPSTWLKQEILMLKDFTTICPPAPSEILAVIGLRNGKDIIDRNLAIIQTSIAAVDLFMEKHQDLFLWHAPKAGSIGFPSIHPDTKMKINGTVVAATARLMCDTLSEEYKIMLLPGDLFLSSDCGAKESSICNRRFRIGLGREDAVEVLGMLESCIREVLFV
eukprot:CFRG3592T1